MPWVISDRSFAGLMAAAVLLGLSACSSQTQQPAASHDPSFSRAPTRLWSAGVSCTDPKPTEEEFSGCRPPVIMGDRGIVLSRIGGAHTLTALDLNTGEVAWTKDADQAWWLSEVDGLLMLESDTGSKMLDPNNGDVRWTTALRPPARENDDPELLQLRVGPEDLLLIEREPYEYTSTWTHRVSKRDGKSRWRADGKPVSTCTGYVVVFRFLTDELVVIDAETGTEVWRLPSSIADEMYSDDYDQRNHTELCRASTLYLSGGAAGIYALAIEDGSVKWHNDLSGSAVMAIEGEEVIVGLENNKRVMLSVADGTEVSKPAGSPTRWRLLRQDTIGLPVDRSTGRLDETATGSTAVVQIAGGSSTIDVVEYQGNLLGIHRDNPRVVWSVDINDASTTPDAVVANDGFVVVRAGDQFTAFGTERAS